MPIFIDISHFFLLLWWVSLLRPAPFELPQGGNAARVKGCSGAIKGACPFFVSFLSELRSYGL